MANKKIKVDGVVHSFPEDATDEEINEALNPSYMKSQQLSPEENLAHIKQKHPLLEKIAEKFSGSPSLEKAGNIAGHFNKAVQGTGLPNAAKGFFEGNADLIRGVGNLIPGVNIAQQRGQEVPMINPIIQQGAEAAGSLGAGLPAYKGYQAAEKGVSVIPGLKNIPKSIQKILAGSAAGSALAPDDRIEGALLGSGIAGAGEAVSKIPSAIKKLAPENPYKIIQKGYDRKKQAASKLFEEAAKEVDNAGAKVKLPKNLITEILEIGPKTETFRNFVDKAKSGDYRAIRKLNTELFHRGERKMSSLLDSDKDVGELLFEKRDKLNESVSKELRRQGLTEAAKKIDKGRNQWRNLQETYHSNNAISKLVGPNREIPSTIKHLTKDAVDINRLKEAHPEIEKSLKFRKNAKAIAGALSALGIGGGLKKVYNDLVG